jgi:hypothetical protein
MTSEVTHNLIQSRRGDPFTSSISRAVEPLKGGKPELKKHSVARDHILADSRIRAILGSIFERLKGTQTDLTKSDPQHKSLVKFFESLCGKETGEDVCLKFEEACRSSWLNDANEAIDIAANGLENLRFGVAEINTKVDNEFDPVVVDGRLDPRSMAVRDAVIGLAQSGLVSFEKALDATAVTKDRLTHQDVSSTVLERSSLNTRTKTRTRIDPFAPPANRASFPRSRSIDLGRPSDLHPTNPVQEPSSEFHYLSRAAMSNSIAQQSESDLADRAVVP